MTAEAQAADTDTPEPPGRSGGVFARLGLGALVGLLSAFLAVGVGEMIAVFVRPAAAPVVVVGNRIILLTPESIKRWVISHFGTNDKPILLTAIFIGIAVLAVIIGILALRRLSYGLLGIAAFGAVGVYCALTTNAHRVSDIIPILFGTAAGLAAMIVLVRAVVGDAPADTGRTLVANRRQFLQAGAGTAVVAAITGFGGWGALAKRYDVSKARSGVNLPVPKSPAPALANGTDLGKGAVPFVTPLKSFYRIDTALAVPQLAPTNWTLNIHGMVDHPLRLSYADLIARPLIERWITLTCVSRTVNGSYNDLIGNARFLGAPLADILREVGVHPGADQLLSRSYDGMTIGTPTAVVMDGRDAMLAIGMDGQPLPVEHGFPVRMVVPGLYGYVSACKWIVEIEATTFAADDAYWVQQGWIPKAPVEISSRIDTPRSSAQIQVGVATNIAGVAWQQHVGISKVEVQIASGGPSGEWRPARLAPVPSIDTWQQWVYPWTPTASGLHTLRVRATGRDGKVQSGENADPYPGAASGYHTISVNVRA